MRNFSLISILIALALGGYFWQKTMVSSMPDRFPDPADYSENRGQNETPECNEYNQDSPECQVDNTSAEQNELEEQRKQGHDVMMKSFNTKYDKYKQKIGGDK